MQVGYLRTSVWKEHKVSIEAQKDIIQSEVGYDTEVTFFEDKGFSGSNTDRPDFLKLKEWVRSSNVSRRLYVSRYDRISRNVQDALNFLKLCQQHNVEVVSVLEPIPSSLGNKQAAQALFVQILFSLAEFSRNVIIENINNSLAQKKIEKKLLSGKAPFGYSYQNGKFVPKEEESKIVRQIFKLYTSTEMGYKQLTKQLNKEGHQFREKSFKSYHIAQILKNTTYAGMIGDKSKNLKPYHSPQVTPIISEEMFQKSTTKRLGRTFTKCDTRKYPLRKKIICPECKGKLTPRKQVSRNNDYHYYACNNESCNQLLINAEKIEVNALEIVSDYLRQDNQFQSLIGALEHQIEEANKFRKQTLKDIDKQKQQLFQAFEEGKLNHNNLKQQLEEINKQQADFTKIDLSKKKLSERLGLFLRLSHTSSKELIWSYIEEIRINKNKQIQEVIIHGVRIQPRNT